MSLQRRTWLSQAAAAAWGLATGAGMPAHAAKAQAPLAGAPPRQRLAPGGIALLALGPAGRRPEVRTPAGVPVLVTGDSRQWTAVVGIPLSAAAGEAQVQVLSGEQDARVVRYRIGRHAYAEQRLTVAPGHVELSPENLARHERERAHQAQVIATFSQPWPERLAMRPPVGGVASSSFGLRRVFNGQPRSPHSGMDIAAATGTPAVRTA